MEWTDYFRELAKTVSLKSKDESTKIGAVIIDTNNSIVSTGYNSFPRGINDKIKSRQVRPEKYFWFEHAERNAIYNAARIGVSTSNCTIYLSAAIPCVDCARAISNSGIKIVYCEDSIGPLRGEQWSKQVDRTLQMFKEAGVTLEFY